MPKPVVTIRGAQQALIADVVELDRSSRNAGFIFALRGSGVDFVFCDMLDANTLTMKFFAVII